MRSYDQVLARNIAAYDSAVEARAATELTGWKRAEHDRFVERLQSEGARSLVEIGAGTGRHGVLLQEAGFAVLATDPSPAMVAHCRACGLEARETDVLGLRLDEPRDAAFAMNSMLHVPSADLDAALVRVAEAVVAGGLFFMGVYGGADEEGEVDDDTYEPRRWFVSSTDERLLEAVSRRFEVVDFHRVDAGFDAVHFQSLTLRNSIGA